MTRVPVGPLQLLDIYHLLSDEERAVQQSVRRLVDETIRPNIAQWYEDGVFPAEVAPRFGKLGLLGMHLEGYGCAGMSAVDYGLARMELGGRGLRCRQLRLGPGLTGHVRHQPLRLAGTEAAGPGGEGTLRTQYLGLGPNP